MLITFPGSSEGSRKEKGAGIKGLFLFLCLLCLFLLVLLPGGEAQAKQMTYVEDMQMAVRLGKDGLLQVEQGFHLVLSGRDSELVLPLCLEEGSGLVEDSILLSFRREGEEKDTPLVEGERAYFEGIPSFRLEERRGRQWIIIPKTRNWEGEEETLEEGTALYLHLQYSVKDALAKYDDMLCLQQSWIPEDWEVPVRQLEGQLLLPDEGGVETSGLFYQGKGEKDFIEPLQPKKGTISFSLSDIRLDQEAKIRIFFPLTAFPSVGRIIPTTALPLLEEAQAETESRFRQQGWKPYWKFISWIFFFLISLLAFYGVRLSRQEARKAAPPYSLSWTPLFAQAVLAGMPSPRGIHALLLDWIRRGVLLYQPETSTFRWGRMPEEIGPSEGCLLQYLRHFSRQGEWRLDDLSAYNQENKEECLAFFQSLREAVREEEKEERMGKLFSRLKLPFWAGSLLLFLSLLATIRMPSGWAIGALLLSFLAYLFLAGAALSPTAEMRRLKHSCQKEQDALAEGKSALPRLQQLAWGMVLHFSWEAVSQWESWKQLDAGLRPLVKLFYSSEGTKIWLKEEEEERLAEKAEREKAEKEREERRKRRPSFRKK